MIGQAIRVIFLITDHGSLITSQEVRLRQGYGATVFALYYDASEDWRQGDSNP